MPVALTLSPFPFRSLRLDALDMKKKMRRQLGQGLVLRVGFDERPSAVAATTTDGAEVDLQLIYKPEVGA
jgi:hypothetical protein